MPAEPTLEVQGLTVALEARQGRMFPVRDVAFSIAPGETLGLVGESGCGKTLTSLAIMGLLPDPPARIASGSIKLAGRELVRLAPNEMRRLRGAEMSMVFQEPLTSLDPVFTIGSQMRAAVKAHRDVSDREAEQLAVTMLERVHMTSPRDRLRQYPHELSGGMRQRVMIAIALSLRPKLLLADEPTTALDVTVQAEILRLIHELQNEFHMAVLFISHNLAVVSAVADRVAVMYTGQIVEEAPARQLFQRTFHPYTRGLLRTLPETHARGEHLHVIPGRVPNLDALPQGCSFAPRCEYAQDQCREIRPDLMAVDSTVRSSRCLRWHELPER